MLQAMYYFLGSHDASFDDSPSPMGASARKVKTGRTGVRGSSNWEHIWFVHVGIPDGR